MNSAQAAATLPPTPAPTPPPLSTKLTLLFAVACGLCVANIYFAQPLIEPIALAIHLPAALAGLVTTLAQLGYGAGLLLLVPLSDMMENRRLILLLMIVSILGLAGAALSNSAATFLMASFVIGVCAVAAQVMVPFASHLAPDATRGKVVGNVMAGLLAGIMLARPFSSIVAAAFGWRCVFAVSAVLMAGLALLARRNLPQRRSSHAVSYRGTMASLPGIIWRTPLLRRRAIYQGLMFATFQAFWTAVPLTLAHDFHFGQVGIALFALAGAGGALAAPWSGRLADRGLTRRATGMAMAAAVVAFGIGAISVQVHSMAGLVVAALVIDGAVQMCQVLSIRSLYMLAPELRGRLNALFMTFIFMCAAIASASAAAIYAFHGWSALCALGGGLALIALLVYATEFRRRPLTSRTA